MTKLYTLKPANSKTTRHPPQLNCQARQKRAVALKSRNNVQATDWSAGPTKQRKSYHHFTMPPKTVTLTPSPTFGNQRNRRSASWISRLTQLQAKSQLPPSATTKNEKKDNYRADTDAVSTQTRSKTEQRRIATEPVSARTRSR